MKCEYCDQDMLPRFQVGDLVQRRESGEVGLVLIVTATRLFVAVLGRRKDTTVSWALHNVDLIHGYIHVTERL